MYECTNCGGDAIVTLWRGSVLYCPSNANYLVFLHSRFSTERPNFARCSNGAVGQTLKVKDGCYSSQLNVSISNQHAFNNVTANIGCLSYNGTHETTIGSSQILPIASKLIQLITSCN